MKRFKIFIVAIISILLIVTIGKLAFAEEYGVELDIKKLLENGTVYLDGTTFKKYTNVQCVQRGTSFKKGYFKITASADIKGETVELIRYGKGNVGETENWNYPTAINTTIVKDSQESNILAAILTSADYSHGYYITEEDMENGKRADSQLAIWYYWNQWSNSLPTEGGLDWGNVFPYSIANEEKGSKEGALNEYYDEGRSLVEQGVFEKYDKTNPNHKIDNFKYIKSAKDGSYIIPENGVYDENDDRYRKLWSAARDIATAHEYHAKIYLVQFYDYKSGEDTKENKNRKAQNLIIYEPKEPIKKLTLEKIWDDSNDKYNVRPDSIKVQITAYARNEQKDTYEPTDVQVYKENDNGTLYTDSNGEYVLENKGRIYEVELSEAKNWKKEIRVRAKAGGALAYYAIKEIKVNGYELDDEATVGHRHINKNEGAIKIGRPDFIADDEIFGTNWSAYIELANKLDGKVNIRAIKAWDDMDDLDGYRPTSITVKLTENNKVTDKTATLSESNNWTYTFEGLEKYEKNSSGEWNKIDYGIIEDEIIINDEKQYEASYEKEVTNATETEPETITYKIKNTHTPHYDGYIEIKGKVWLDAKKEDPIKTVDINGVLNDWEKGIEGIKVTLKDANGQQFDPTSTAETREDGTYTIKVNFDDSKGVYKLYGKAEEVKAKLLTSYVEFEYDGMLFTTVKPLASEDENQIISKAKEIEGSSEDEATRKYVDEKYDEVFGKNEADIRNTDATPELQLKEDNSGIPYLEYEDKYWDDKNVKATTQNVISFDNYPYKTTETRTENVRCCKGDKYIRTNPENNWDTPIEEKIDEHTEHSKQCTRTYDVEVGVINDVNLGLFEREQPEIGITTDLKNVEVMMNNQKYTYIYDAFVEENQNVVGMKTDFQNKYTYTYRGPVNPATIAEAIKENHEDISVNVTYKIMVKNHSNTLNTNIHKIVNYFDLEYTLNTPGWTIINNDNQDRKFNKAISNDLNKILGPGDDFKMDLTYTISLDAIKGLLQQNATLNNASEIESFSTTYGENTSYAETISYEDIQKGGRSGKPYAGYAMGDVPEYKMKSHPGNAGIYLDESDQRLKIQVSEVDTDIAPSFVLFKDDPKILSGNIWEDNDIDSADNKRLGNGIKDGVDTNVSNVKVQLYKVETYVEENGEVKVKRDANGKPIISGDIALLYKTIPTINADGSITIETKPAEVFSNADGYFAFGDSEYGVPTGAYIIKYTYGNGIDGTVDSKIGEVVINARNYKSTIITQDANEVLYSYYKDDQINDQWHLNTAKGHSVAVDNMEQRVAITDLKYSNFDEAVNISAYSQPFVMQVEFDKSAEKTGKVDENGKTPFGNELNIFDFGIVERAREDLFVEKTINDIQITQGDPLNGGLTITSGNPNTGALNWVKAMGFGTTSTNGSQARMANEKLASVELDVTLIQNSQLYIEYALRVVNNSEIDYDYYLGNESEPYDPSKVKTEYYYFGTTNEDGENNIITSSINEVVDFVDTDLNYEYPTGWDRKDEKYFADGGLLNEDTIKLVKDGKYAAYVTTIYEDLAPGEPSTVQTIKAQRTLTNSSENKYENHAEILKIDSKVARTIKGRQTAGGNIEVKEYKMGNFVPSTALRTRNNEGYVKVGNEAEGLHEQDDDTVILAIGTPTGVTNYTLHYIIAAVIALIVIIFGVIFIKKKVLTK